VIRDSAGNLYGTTSQLVATDLSVVYKLDPAGHYTVLYSFSGGADGNDPGGLILDSAGNLYGVAGSGSTGAGLVFKLDTSGQETVLYSFTGGADGSGPNAIIRDSAGNFYGTTLAGGKHSTGVVFKLTP
jgi:uncharacterized repeat protein (TIGR03803 family)